MDLHILFPALPPAPWIVGLTLAAMATLWFIIALARRKHSYWWLPMAMLATGLSATAFASWAGLRALSAVVNSVQTSGGGIAAICAGISASAQLPLAASWIALITSLGAALFLPRLALDERSTGQGSHPAAFGLLIAAGLTIGLVPLLAFAPATSLIVRAIMPGTAIPAGRLLEHLLAYRVITAACFVVALAVVVATTRLALRSHGSRALSFIVTIAVVVTVAISAFSVASFHDLSSKFGSVARYGRVSIIEP